MCAQTDVGTAGNTGSFSDAHPLSRRFFLALAAVSLGVFVAGFWNYHFVDGLGQSAIAGPIVGDTREAAGLYASGGVAFGVVFAVAAGLAATFTACNCVVFAMLPELACKIDDREGGIDRETVYRSLVAFVGGVVVVALPYGAFIGLLGPEGIEAMNTNAVRLAQAQAVFSALGVGLLVWGAAELGFLGRVAARLDDATLAFLGQPATRAGVMGLFVGLFAVGRPFPVFRDFLTYAATAESPLYGMVVMAIHGLGMIAVMIVLLLAMVHVLGDRMTAWVQRNPHNPQLLSGFALLAGGAYFVFYWGLAFAFGIGRWGYRIGIYGG